MAHRCTSSSRDVSDPVRPWYLQVVVGGGLILLWNWGELWDIWQLRTNSKMAVIRTCGMGYENKLCLWSLQTQKHTKPPQKSSAIEGPDIWSQGLGCNVPFCLQIRNRILIQCLRQHPWRHRVGSNYFQVKGIHAVFNYNKKQGLQLIRLNQHTRVARHGLVTTRRRVGVCDTGRQLSVTAWHPPEVMSHLSRKP